MTALAPVGCDLLDARPELPAILQPCRGDVVFNDQMDRLKEIHIMGGLAGHEIVRPAEKSTEQNRQHLLQHRFATVARTGENERLPRTKLF